MTHTYFHKTRGMIRSGVIIVALSTLFFAGVHPHAHADAPTVPVDGGAQASQDYSGGTYKFLAPISALPGIGDTLDVTGGGFNQYIKAVLDFVIGLIGVLGVIRIVKAGIDVITTEGVEAKKKAKESITAVVWSFLLIAGSWIVINTIDPRLTNAGLILDPIEINVKYTIEKALDSVYNTPPGNDVNGVSTGEALDSQTLSAPGWYIYIDKERKPDGTEAPVKKFLGPYAESGICGDAAKQKQAAYDNKTTDSHANTSTFSRNCYEKRTIAQSTNETELRKQLAGGGVYVYNHACGSWGQKGCTTVGSATFNYLGETKSIPALGAGTISFLLDLAAKNAQTADNCTTGYQAPCAVLITGGTEIWAHSDHGKPDVVDLAYRPALINYIYSHASVQAPSFNNVRYLVDGWWFTDEMPGATQNTTGHHFHICNTEDTFWYCHNPPVGRNNAAIGCYKVGEMSAELKRRYDVKVTSTDALYCNPQIPVTK